MKKFLFYVTLLFASVNVWSQVTITEQTGSLESAFIKWNVVPGADSYNVYYTGGGKTDVKIDEPLIRSYNTYFRADIPGLAAGTYTITVKPVTGGIEGTGATSSSITVLAQDRTGFAFEGGKIPGAYNLDGTLKTNAVVVYITQNTKNTVSLNVTGATANPCVGLQTILDGFKKGKDARPLAVRLIGNITDLTYMLNGDIVIENKNFASSSITFEGVGSDAVANGWGLRIKNASNIEVRNLGFMLTNAAEGDNVGLQQANDHIWVHNCDMFYGSAGGDADQVKGDGALDAKLSTYVTFSYNHFWDSGKCNLLGLSEDTTEGLYITYHHNWYDHSDSRHPRVRFYSAHVYNNYYDGNSKYGAGSTLGSSVFMESNFFRNCKYPMLTSLQGSDIYNDPTGGFSGEVGGTIKAFNNSITGATRYVPYNASTNAIEFDAIEVATRNETIPASITSKVGANTYNNFDTNPAVMYTYTADSPTVARDNVIAHAGRVSGGDLKYTFNNAVDDASSALNTALKASLTNYTSSMLYVQGETPVVVNTQTLTSTDNNDQTVAEGVAIADMIFTWGGDATDVTVSGLPTSGITFVKDALAKTITVSGTPTTDISFTVTTSGTSGTPVTLPGNITVIPNGTVLGDQIHNFTLSDLNSTFYTITGNLTTKSPALTYDELSLTKGLKLETSAGVITYSTPQTSTLTLVFYEAAAKVKVDGVTLTASSGIVTINNILSGSHKIEKASGTATLMYVKTAYATLGLGENVKTPKLTLYPNPTTDILYLSSSDQKIKSVVIYSFTGALVKSISNDAKSIDVSNLSNGSYLVKVTTNQGSFTQKIIKK